MATTVQQQADLEMNPAAWFHVLGVRVDAVQIPDVVKQVLSWVEDRSVCRYISLANTHVVMEAQEDPVFRESIKSADLCVPDGMPLIWCGRFFGHSLPRRVYGPELMATICRETASRGARHYFYGGTGETLDQLVACLRQSCPGIQISGAYSPPFRPLTQKEDSEAIERINRSFPDIVWVGLGCPKQERWMYDHRNRLKAAVLIGVGQAFDILSQRKKQAPSWMQEHGLEWLFRLVQEPKRTWRRYLAYNPKFIYFLFLQFLGIRKFD